MLDTCLLSCDQTTTTCLEFIPKVWHILKRLLRGNHSFQISKPYWFVPWTDWPWDSGSSVGGPTTQHCTGQDGQLFCILQNSRSLIGMDFQEWKTEIWNDHGWPRHFSSVFSGMLEDNAVLLATQGNVSKVLPHQVRFYSFCVSTFRRSVQIQQEVQALILDMHAMVHRAWCQRPSFHTQDRGRGHVQRLDSPWCGDLSAFNRWHCWDPLGNDSETPLLEAFGHITVVALKPVRVPSWVVELVGWHLSSCRNRDAEGMLERWCQKGGEGKLMSPSWKRRPQNLCSYNLQLWQRTNSKVRVKPVDVWEGLVKRLRACLYKQIKKEQLLSQAFAWQPLLAAAAFRLVLTALRFAAAIMSTHLRWTLCRTPKAEMELRNSNLQ